ncbi:hypothetical protein B0H21DRAFT_709916 [Amylocystis lapponica]|nr:hypothetical protein B0H21DRAFT_709916 [Amylocystis lapponica]
MHMAPEREAQCYQGRGHSEERVEERGESRTEQQWRRGADITYKATENKETLEGQPIRGNQSFLARPYQEGWSESVPIALGRDSKEVGSTALAHYPWRGNACAHITRGGASPPSAAQLITLRIGVRLVSRPSPETKRSGQLWQGDRTWRCNTEETDEGRIGHWYIITGRPFRPATNSPPESSKLFEACHGGSSHVTPLSMSRRLKTTFSKTVMSVPRLFCVSLPTMTQHILFPSAGYMLFPVPTYAISDARSQLSLLQRLLLERPTSSNSLTTQSLFSAPSSTLAAPSSLHLPSITPIYASRSTMDAFFTVASPVPAESEAEFVSQATQTPEEASAPFDFEREAGFSQYTCCIIA